MSLAVLHSRALVGMDAPSVTVEVHLANGLPSFTIVGLPETEVKESRDRVRAALATCRFEFPARRVTVTLVPAELPKEGGRFDLPIPLGILAASGQIPSEGLRGHEFAGELSLSGELRPVRGALAMTLGSAKSGRSFVLPRESAGEGSLAAGARVLAAGSLLEVCAHLAGDGQLQGTVRAPCPAASDYPDLSDVKGQAQVKRALEVAAAGGHSVLMTGPPGTGKSMLAARFPGLLPEMGEQEALESAAIQSLASGGFRIDNWKRRPFRAPPHSAPRVPLVGGGGGGRKPANRPPSSRSPAADSGSITGSAGRFALRTTRPRASRWWAGAAIRGRVRFRLRTTACCFSTNSPNSGAGCLRRCANRWSPAALPYRGRRARRNSRRAFNWSRR